MKLETIAIDRLSADAANVRLHPTKSVEAIMRSLKRFGQQKPIVVDAKGVVRAGNGTLAAAKALGWKRIAFVRTALTGSEATAFAIADNRTQDLSEFDEDALAMQLESLAEDGVDLADLGFGEADLQGLLDEADAPPPAAEREIEDRWLIVLTCKDEQEQAGLLARFAGEGLKCKALIG